MPRSRELFDFDAIVKLETDRAWLLDDGEHADVWIPKSTGQDNGDGTFTIPMWLATEKGLV